MAAKDAYRHAALEGYLLTVLSECTPDRREIITGGHDAAALAQLTHLSVQTIRRTLKQMSQLGLTVSFAPRKWEREDGKTGMTLVWFKTSKGYRIRQSRMGSEYR